MNQLLAADVIDARTFREARPLNERVLELLVEWEFQHGQGNDLSAEELCRNELGLLEELRAGIRRRLFLQGLLDPPTPGPAQSPAPVPKIQGYELLEVIGHGGMGVVYKARQRELHRLVAIKMILSGVHAGPEERSRFQTEAEAVARLHHPNIVQIFEVGQSDGHPYVALEYVAGGSLAAHLDGTPWPSRRAAELLHTLARAMHHAHERDIIHRDLKPGNILLQKDGGGSTWDDGEPKRDEAKPAANVIVHPSSYVPKITDFGLAKRLDQEHGHTMTGAVLGSPSYMAPEQADGKNRSIGPAADVYALGAILYELLTGRPPARGATPLETLYQVQHQEPATPRSLYLGVPRDLEVIALKCLRKEPQRRYASAAALADDLQRFLDGKPIHARPVGSVERVWRWCQRHRAVASLLGILMLSIVVGIVGIASQWRRAEAEASEARNEREKALRQWERAELNFNRAKAAVERMAGIGRELIGQPRLDKTGRQILEEALTYYQSFLDEKADDPAMQKEVARAWMRTGDIQARLGDWPKATETYRRGIALLEGLANAPNALPAATVELALSIRAQAHVLRYQNRTAEANTEYGRAYALLETLLIANPDNLNYQESQANTLMNWSIVHRAEERWEDAVAACRQAADLLRNMQSRRGRIATQLELALALDELAAALRLMERLSDAEESSREALAIREQIHTTNPNQPTYRDYLARSHAGLANILVAKGELAEGIKAHQLAVPLWDGLASEYPNRPDYRRALAASQSQLGTCFSRMGQGPEAESAYRACVAVRQKLATEFPREPAYSQDLAAVLSRLGRLLSAGNRHNEAARIFEQLLAIKPTSPILYNQIAWVLLTCPEARLRDSRRALSMAKTATEQLPTSADGWNTLGFAHYREGDWAAAATALEKAVSLRKRPDPVDALVLAMACQRLGRSADAQRWHEQSLQLAKSTGASDDDVKELRDEAAELLRNP